jgi:D-alanine-D-alanine ligase
MTAPGDDLHVDVSVRSGRRVADALRATGVETSIRDVDAELVPFLHSTRPDVVWPVLHGATGEDGSVREVLELLRLPYVGTGPQHSRIAWDKAIAKSVVLKANVHTPDYVAVQQELFRELGARTVLTAALEQIGLPLVVKPARGGSALGVTLVRSEAELPAAMVHCFAYGDVAMIERAISGTEVGVSMIETDDGIRVLPPVEVVTDGAYDYDARYSPGRSEYFVPARLGAETAAATEHAAVTAFEVLGLRDLARVDLIVDPDGVPHFLETNVAPGMTETSLFPQAASASGSGLAQTYRAIAERAASRG